MLADTKFEFGLSSDGGLVLGDEVLTPDSSRFWPAETWEPGIVQPSFDKQYVRDWLTSSGWDRVSTAAGTARRRRRRHPRPLRHRLREAHRPDVRLSAPAAVGPSAVGDPELNGRSVDRDEAALEVLPAHAAGEPFPGGG